MKEELVRQYIPEIELQNLSYLSNNELVTFAKFRKKERMVRKFIMPSFIFSAIEFLSTVGYALHDAASKNPNLGLDMVLIPTAGLLTIATASFFPGLQEYFRMRQEKIRNINWERSVRNRKPPDEDSGEIGVKPQQPPPKTPPAGEALKLDEKQEENVLATV